MFCCGLRQRLDLGIRIHEPRIEGCVEMAMKFKVSRLCKYTLIALLPLLLVAELVQFNTPEAVALLWHLRHGFKAQCCGVRIHVPLRYRVVDEPRSLSLFGTPGYIRWKLFQSPTSIISLFGNYDQTQARRGKERLIASYERAGNRFVGSKTIQVAGKPLECSELYVDHFGVSGPKDTVFCAGNGLIVHFEGSPLLLNEFYSIVQGAQATP
jgi:hypothetical protein